MKLRSIYLDPDENEASGGGAQSGATPPDLTPQDNDTNNVSDDVGGNQPTDTTESVMAEFEKAGFTDNIGVGEKKPLPEVRHPQQDGIKKEPAAAPEAKSKESAKPVEGEENKEDIFTQLKKHKAGAEQKVEKPLAPKGSQDDRKQIQKAVPQGRDYAADLPPEYHELARNMSSPAYRKFVEIVKENQTLKTDKTVKSENGVPVSYYEHPDSYLLSPEFGETTGLIQQSDAVLNHWQAQKAKILAGEDWQDLDVNEEGKIVLGRVMPANEDAKVRIGQYIQHTTSQRQGLIQKANQIKTGFVEKTKATRNWLAQQEDIHLPWFKDEKYEGWEIAKEVFKQLPAELRHSPLASTVAKLTAHNRISTGYLKMLMAENAEYKRQLEAMTGVAHGQRGTNGAVKGAASSGGNGGAGNNGLKSGDVDMKDLAEQFADFLPQG